MPRELIFPLAINASGGFAYTEDYSRTVRQHVISRLGTQPGERVMNGDYGTDTLRYLFEVADETLARSLDEGITESLNRLPDGVTFEDTIVTVYDSYVDISVRYSLSNGSEGVANFTRSTS